MDSSHPIGPKQGQPPHQKETEEKNLIFRSFIGCSEIVEFTVPRIIQQTTQNDKLCQSQGVGGKKRKFDVRNGGGEKDPATPSIHKTSKVIGKIISLIGSRSATLVIHPPTKRRRIK